MQKVVVCLLVIALLAGSCIKNETGCPAVDKKAPASEKQAIKDYLTNNSITANEDGSGVFYSIENYGTGNFPTTCSSIEVTFDGYLTNGNIFEFGDNKVLNLQHMLPGWRIGVPFIKPGGKIKLYLPPSLAYEHRGKKDENGVQLVAPGSIVIYDITLHNFY